MILRMDQTKIIRSIDQFILFCFCGLVIFLPIGHTEAIRSFAMLIPPGLWIIKMGIQRRWVFYRTPLDFPLALYSLVVVLSLVTAVDFRYSLDEAIGEWATGMLLFYTVVNNFRQEHTKYLLGALLFGNLLMLGVGISEFFACGAVLSGYNVRIRSLHSGFGTFSTYLITVLPYLSLSLFYLPRSRQNGALRFLVVLNLFALYLTQSRGAWIVVPVLLVGIGWIFFSRKIFLILLMIAGLATLWFFFFFSPPEFMRHYTFFKAPNRLQSKIETGQARLWVTQFVVKKIWENPFQMLGFGQRSFVKKYPDIYLQYKGLQLWHAHNTFLDIAVQTGVQGLVIFLLFLYKLLNYCYQRSKQNLLPLRQYYFLATFFMVIALFIRCLSDSFFIDDSALLFWFLIGMAMAIHHEKEKEISYKLGSIPGMGPSQEMKGD